MTDVVTATRIYTYEDYLAFPDDGQRYEIIEGELFVTPSPFPDHQYPTGELFAILRQFVREHQLGNIWFAPFDVLISENTIVQPDVCFIRTENAPAEWVIPYRGVPDLVIEVLSDSTYKIDEQIKFKSYEKAGVQEYWLVSPRTKSVRIWTLKEGDYVLHGEFVQNDVISSPLLPGLQIVNSSIFYSR